MIFRCYRCGKEVSDPVWIMWRGRLSRVGQDCAERIREERRSEALEAERKANDQEPAQ